MTTVGPRMKLQVVWECDYRWSGNVTVPVPASSVSPPPHSLSAALSIATSSAPPTEVRCSTSMVINT